VPVDWIDDPDSRVDVLRTALEDLRGVARLMAAGRVFRFMAVGVASTLAYAALFLALRAALGAAVFALTLGLTSGALDVLHALAPRPSRALELGVLVAASTAATVTRYVALRTWVFAPSRRSAKKRRILAQASSADGPS
jgi:putative flippase GtrA